MNSIGKRLREERERIGKNQTEFGTLGGVQMRAQINYEQDKRQPDAAYLSAIAAAGVDLQYVLLGVRSPKEPRRAGITLHEVVEEVLTPEEAVMLDNFRHCSDEVQQAAKAQLAAMAKPKGKVKRAG